MKAMALLIPIRDWVGLSGEFRWPGRCVLAGAVQADRLPLGQLAADLRRAGHSAAVRLGGAGAATVRMIRDPSIRGAEHYYLYVRPEGITVAASADAAAYYGIQTVRQMLAVRGRSIPACVIDDWPDFRRRGVCLDCSHGKVPTLATLKALVERLARWKINELQLYIENVFAFRRHPLVGRGYSPFTAPEICSLQEHCRRHHVRLVGALASFGHMDKILSLPKYRPLSEMPEGGSELDRWTLCPTDPRSIRFLGELYAEFLPLFEAEDFNACCDETSNFTVGRSRRRSERLGAGRVYLEFLLKIHGLCRRHGKRMNIWADVMLKYPHLLRELPGDIVMLNWDYEANGPRIARSARIARTGLALGVCPGTSSWQTHGTRLGNAMGNVAHFAAAGRRCGAEGLLNTDWGDYGHRNFLGVSLHGFAHGAAHGWRGEAVDEAKFTESFCFHVFGQSSPRLADGLAVLGDSYRRCGGDNRNSCALYHALVEPLVGEKDYPFARIDRLDPAGLRGIIDALSDERIWPKPPGGMDRFEATALQEFPVAAAMDVLACRRALVAKDLRAGKTVRRRELASLTEQMHQVARRFAALWRVRNKPSRLRDNLALLHRAETESRRLARRA
ncbi:MAG: beta-N-acetylhexosaminidase [Phycisphaerae bacterium]|nr:beta-N-acetylhexosaminidase [Phycisphaerae bacterium]